MQYSQAMRTQFSAAERRFNAILEGSDARSREVLREAGRRIEGLMARYDTDDEYYAHLSSLRSEVSREMARVAGRELETIHGVQQRAGELAISTAEEYGHAVERAIDEMLDWAAGGAQRISSDVVDVIGRAPYGAHPLSETVWRVTNDTVNEIFRETHTAIVMGQSPLEAGRAVRQNLLDPEGSARAAGTARGLRTRAATAIAQGDDARAARLRQSARDREQQLPHPGRGTYRSAARNSARVTRTEAIRVYQEATYNYGLRHDWVEYFEWVPNPAACELCAYLGGIYVKTACPYMPHPHCMCKIIPVPSEKYARMMGIEIGEPREADNRQYWVDQARQQTREAA